MSREPRWNLTLTLHGPDGTLLGMTLPLDHMRGMELARISPPRLYDFMPVCGGRDPMTQVAEVIRKRTYRKSFFIEECQRLGQLLAERMEDAEGWHDESRIEPAKQQLRGR
mgnify:CR=1 FL=1